MKQILHIFKKDTRRFWIEILISMALMFAFAVVDTNDWKVFHDQQTRNRMEQFVGILVVLMTASWWLFIARVVQAETLVGDRQFWITRPYEWKKLLAAKLLFVTAWFVLPYLLAQMLLLAEAGFHPWAFLPGTLSTVLLVGIVFLVPVWSVAAVTSNLARLVLTVLGCIIVVYGYMFLVYGYQHGYTSANPYTNVFLFPLLFCGCALAITLQYGTRRTWMARGLLLVLPVLLALSVAAYHRQSLVDTAYPQQAAGAVAPVSITLSRSSTDRTMSPTAEDPVQTRSRDGEYFMSLPLKFTGVAAGSAVFTNDLRLTLTAADGTEWSSPWQATLERILPGTHLPRIELIIPPDVYNRFKAAPVTLRVDFAISRYQAGTVTQLPFPSGDVAVPGIGFCAPQRWGLTALECRSAIDQPPLTYIAATWRKGACEDGAPPPDAVTEGYSWLEPQGPDFSIVSVRSLFMWFRGTGSEEEPQGKGWRICPGTPLTLTQYHLADRTQASVTSQNFVLPRKVWDAD
jgi:hypothetical protein